MKDELYEQLLEDHYLEIYEEYEKRHPEEIHSDFMLEEDGDESIRLWKELFGSKFDDSNDNNS